MATRFGCDYAKRVAGCKKCKLQLQKGELRLAKITPNFFVQNSDQDNPAPDMKMYYHPHCLFEMFNKARATTKVIEEEGDIEDWEMMTAEDKELVSKMIEDLGELRKGKGGGAKAGQTPKSARKRAKKEEDDEEEDEEEETPSKPKKPVAKKAKIEEKEDKMDQKEAKGAKKEREGKTVAGKKEDDEEPDEASKFNSFQKFCKLCDVIGSVSKYTDKSQAVHMFITKDNYDGDVHTLIRLLLPGTDQRVYNMKEKQILKHFAEIFDLNHEELVNQYKSNGDASAVVRETLEKKKLIPSAKSDWSIQKVDRWLTKLTELTKDEEQLSHIKFATKRLSGLELMYLIRLVKKDLRFNAGTKHILEGLHASAYESFQSCRDLKEIIDRCRSGNISGGTIEVGIKLGTPVLPMLAEACRSVEQAMSRCPNGMYAEIKYDGERVQVHKKGKDFTFFSRSLKPSQNHKVAPFEKAIPQAFAKGDDLILDAEVLMVDTATGKPLPFGSLGIHKKGQFKNACPCLFVFDILRYNDQDLTAKPIKERRAILEEHMVEVKNTIMFSNSFLIEHGDKEKLHTMIWKAIDEGLEGLVLKDIQSKYEPGKRHWLKVKKDYLEQGKMADTADLLVLGAYFGTGNKGGIMSVFLMGVRDPVTKTYRTVTKCGNGPKDKELDQFNKQLSKKMKRIDRVYENLPLWLQCSRSLVPDFVIEDPESAPVWEITGAEFSKSDNHTADGISIRFPRLTKVRDDKDWKSATSLEELKNLFKTSKIKSDIDTTQQDEVPLYSKDSQEEADKLVPPKDQPQKEKLSEDKDGEAAAKTDDNQESSAEDEEKCPERMTPCKYGKKCYRKNKEHKEEFWHPK